MSDVVPDTAFLFSIGAAIGSLSANKSYKVSDVRNNNNSIFFFEGSDQ